MPTGAVNPTSMSIPDPALLASAFGLRGTVPLCGNDPAPGMLARPVGEKNERLLPQDGHHAPSRGASMSQTPQAMPTGSSMLARRDLVGDPRTCRQRSGEAAHATSGASSTQR